MIEQEIGCKINWKKKTSNVILKKRIDIKSEDFDGKFPAKKYKVFLEAIFLDFVLKCSDGNDWTKKFGNYSSQKYCCVRRQY